MKKPLKINDTAKIAPAVMNSGVVVMTNSTPIKSTESPMTTVRKNSLTGILLFIKIGQKPESKAGN